MSENTTPGVSSQYGTVQISDFDWILDKNLLRDEGVYFGLSDSEEAPSEKVDTIRQFFQERIKALETDCLSHHSQSNATKQIIDSILLNIAERRATIQKLKDAFVVGEHNFWRYLIGLVSYSLILIFNFGLIYSWLEAGQVKAPLLTTLGVYLFGSLSLFGQFSLLYHSDAQALHSEGEERESWKVYLEEFFIPFIASVYISFKGMSTHTGVEVGVFFLLIYLLFLFAGKGFLTQLVKAKTELAKMVRNYTGRKALKAQTALIDAEIQADVLKLETSQKTLQEINAQILEAEKAIAMISEQKETNVLLFLSEYELAKSARQALNRKQISQIISSRR